MIRRLLRRVGAEPTRIDVRHAEQTFAVRIRRRDVAKRMTLRVSGATGDIVLTLPPRAPFRTARAFAEAHGGWIAARLARVPVRVGFEPGALVPLRGVPHRIVHESAGRGRTTTRLEPEPCIVVHGDAAGLPGRVRRFLAGEASRDLKEAVRHYTALLGVTAKRITLRDTRSRWGSCSSTGALSFSWRLVLAPPFVLDYLAAHEAAHLREMNHSARFWRVLHESCAHTDDAEAWLKQHGHALHRYG